MKPGGSMPHSQGFSNNPFHIASMEEDRSHFKILTGKHTGNKPLGRPSHR